jgi:hypothetical protein
MLQHLIVLALVVVCVAYIAKQAIGTLRGRKGNLGSCCSKGCNAGEQQQTQAKTQFLPAEMLIRRR